MTPLWLRTLLQHAALLIAGGFVGWLYDAPFWGLFTATAVLLAWHVYHLYLLERWLTTGAAYPLPAGNGPWSQVIARIELLRRRTRASRDSWRRLVKEIQASTKAFPDGGVILNRELEIVRSNKAARGMLGLKKKRDRGMRIDNLIRHPGFIRYLESGSPKTSVVIPSPLAADRWLSCRLIPFGAEQKLLLVRDISETVNLERMRRDFVANASHELRTPLTVIAGYLDAMADEAEFPAAWREPVRDMQEQAARMRRLVADLLELSRLESAGSSSREQRVDVRGLIDAVLRDALAGEHAGRQLSVEVAQEAALLGEPGELKSILGNLVSNALRYTPADGRISVHWWVDGQGGHLAVRDTGIGIAADDIPRVTERFYRTSAARARQEAGTGLGLAIVKHALKRHDADLEIHSEPGKGSEFICHFPADRVVTS
ncbi:MAG: phosphate regulon sensor histidine kinase PhoR [Gammaproteobacteria bacterium]|nr:MAG: phosphate regulon sensor histidine kinase PhoR [Gammaproteobacteria bacterium]